MLVSLFLRVLFYGAVAGTVTSAIYCGMVLAGAAQFARRKRREEREPKEFLPPVSVLKPLHGTEPDLEENLKRFFELDYPEFELLFCARHESDTGLQMAKRIGNRLSAGAGAFRYLRRAAGSECEDVVADGAERGGRVRDAGDQRRRRAGDAGLSAAVRAGAGRTRKRELASCLYIGRTTGGLAAQLDAVGKSVEMSGGIFVADMIEGGTRFALGVSMVLRREAFAMAGGYEDLGQYFAEDFVLGQRLAAKGYGVRMANYVVRLMVMPQGLRGSFRDQLRWMKSTRRSRPAGHLGTGLTYAVPFGLLGLAWGLLSGHPLIGLLWLLGTCVNRWVMAAVVLWALEDEQAAKPTLIYPLRDLLGFVVWVASYIPSRTDADIVRGQYDANSRRPGPTAAGRPAGGAGLPNAPVRGK